MGSSTGADDTISAAPATEERDASASARAAGESTSARPEPTDAGQSATTFAGTGRASAPRSMATGTEQTVETITISCLTNTHYHAGREAFLDTVHRWFMFAVIALGAAALVDFLPEDKKWIKGACSAGAAIIAALDLTFDLSNRARSHAMMRRLYYDLLSEVKEGKQSPIEARVALDRLSGDEEPPYRVLLLSCWNLAQASVYGAKAKRFNISVPGMFMKNIFRRPGAMYTVTEPVRN